MPDTSDPTVRIHALYGRHVADDLGLTATEIGGEIPRADLIAAAIDRGGWTTAERIVAKRRASSVQPTHLTAIYDDAVEIARDRGLVTATGGGRWRAAAPAPSRIVRRRFGRVFLAAVGLGDDPVADDYDAAEFATIWFATASRRITKGDHVFIVGAGHHGKILGLYEVTSTGMTTTPKHYDDPERWKYAVAVRPLARVFPPQATTDTGIRAPQGNLVMAKTEELDTLYGAVEAFALAGDEVIEPDVDGPAPARLRRARPFDPDRSPEPADLADRLTVSPMQALALQEKARQGHHHILVRLVQELRRTGWEAIEEIPAAIDLWARSPQGRRVIFEAKTLRHENVVTQSRSGLAQLLEYRHEHGTATDALCLVTTPRVAAERAALLQALGVAALTVTEHGWHGENEAAATLGLGIA